MNTSTFYEANRSLWDQRTPIHVNSQFYDVDGFIADPQEISLMDTELGLLPQIKDQTLLHLQCHFGLDSLSWARLGAKVTGVDFSDEAIRTAKTLAEKMGLSARFIVSDIYALDEVLAGETFDHIFTSYGVLLWLHDLQRWAEIIAKHLKVGGTFTLVEFHPLPYMYDFRDDEWQLQYSYFNTAQPIHEKTKGTYADPTADIEADEYTWNHSLSEVISVLLSSGLVLTHFGEYPFSHYDVFPNLKQTDENHYELSDMPALPLMFSIQARKP